jgi:hypothetical protein
MSALHQNSDLPAPLLRALGELYVAVIELDRLLARADPASTSESGGWRDRALAASDESRRVAVACATARVVADAVVVRSIDGSRTAMTAANVHRLTSSIVDLTRRGQLLEADPAPIIRR